MDGKKADAMNLLKKASKNVVSSDNDYLEYGLKAPMDTWFYLAHAYHLNDSLNSAIVLYTDVKKKLEPSQAFHVDYIDNHINACRYAVEMESSPVSISTQLFAPWLNDYPGANDPVVSKNDSVFIFTQVKEGKNHIYCSYKNTAWQKPVDITSQLGGCDRLYSNSLTVNGDHLILYMDDGADGNLFSSQRNGTTWSKIRKLGKNINTKYWEAHGFITPDGKELFFSSNRPGGFGELDIWMSKLEENGNWGPAVNLGNDINTHYNENTPFFLPESGTLIFSSLGNTSIGGYDIFSSVLKNTKWTKPIGMPYPINNTGDNSFFAPYGTGSNYITSLVDPDSNLRNVYRLSINGGPSDKIIAAGSVDLQDGMNIVPGLAEIRINEPDSATVWKKIQITDSGLFKFIAKPGYYQLHVGYSGYKTDTIDLTIPDNYTGKSLSLNSSLVPEKVSSGDFLVIKNILFDFNNHILNDQSKFELEKLIPFLSNHQKLNIEVTGYTDIKGSADYNIQLAGRRAQSVINYLSSSGISESRVIKKAVGAADFAAVNFNPDGSDNSEGRQYNRRVTIGIVNPQTGITLVQESYTPPQLRDPHSLKYSIVLMKSNEKFYPDYFSDFKMNELFFVRPVLKDSVYLYVLGEFSNMSNAESFLTFARGKGFSDGYIVDQYELLNEPKQLLNSSGGSKRNSNIKIYIIQLKALKIPLNLNQFRGIEGVKEIKGNDGYYRYVYGEFEGFYKAKSSLEIVHKSGFEDAFIKEYNLLIKQ
jgi:outer membrane protein OmpA-like peptidoglycan-associated protein